MMLSDLDDEDTLPTEDDALFAALAQAASTSLRVEGWAADSDVGRVRSTNEDAWGAFDDRVFTVADGMGGHVGGEVASTVAVRVLLHEVKTNGVDQSWPTTFERVNESVLEAGRQLGLDGLGSTQVALHVGDRRGTVVCVGDSRVYRRRGPQLVRLTTDHNVGTELLAAGIQRAQLDAIDVPLRGLTAYIGVPSDRFTMDLVDVSLEPGDRVLLCSDGVHGQVGPTALMDCLAAPTPEACVRQLLDHARAAGGRDNATAVVVDIGSGA